MLPEGDIGESMSCVESVGRVQGLIDGLSIHVHVCESTSPHVSIAGEVRKSG